MVTKDKAKEALDSIICKSRVHLYKPIQVAEILYMHRVYNNINLGIMRVSIDIIELKVKNGEMIFRYLYLEESALVVLDSRMICSMIMLYLHQFLMFLERKIKEPMVL